MLHFLFVLFVVPFSPTRLAPHQPMPRPLCHRRACAQAAAQWPGGLMRYVPRHPI